MKYFKNEAGNIVVNLLLVVVLFTIAYVWYDNQPEVQPSKTKDELPAEELAENQNSPTQSEVIPNIKNLGVKSEEVPANQNVQPEPTPAPLNSVVLTENETGNFVTIAYANLTQPGFIAIYRINSQNKTAPIGHTDLLSPKIITNLKLQLDTQIAKGQTIVAVLHKDDGDGEFEFPESDPYVKNGEFIVSDVDVVDVRPEREAKNLKNQIDTYFESSF